MPCGFKHPSSTYKSLLRSSAYVRFLKNFNELFSFPYWPRVLVSKAPFDAFRHLCLLRKTKTEENLKGLRPIYLVHQDKRREPLETRSSNCSTSATCMRGGWKSMNSST